MTLTRSLKLAVAVGVAVLATSFTANLAKAGDSSIAYKGTFTLPFEAHWGSLVLPAGEYSFKIDDQTPNNTIAVTSGNRYLGFVLIGSITDQPTAGKSELVAVSTGDAYSVSTLRLQGDGERDYVVEFAIPKTEGQMPARGPEVSMLVPVSMIAR
jgi:hypothetical protein